MRWSVAAVLEVLEKGAVFDKDGHARHHADLVQEVVVVDVDVVVEEEE